MLQEISIMRQAHPISDDLLAVCEQISSPDGYRHFHEELTRQASSADPARAQRRLTSLNPEHQAKAFLVLAARGDRLDGDVAQAALATRESRLIAAASFAVTQCCASELDLQRCLLPGPTPWEPSAISDDARYLLIRFMGYSGNSAFVEVLREALFQHPHFCPPGATAPALAQLGDELDPLKSHHDRSIAVDPGSSGIIISHDDKFSGHSTCPQCRYFPCRINRYFPGAIQDCSFWNKTDPDTQGEIRDLR